MFLKVIAHSSRSSRSCVYSHPPSQCQPDCGPGPRVVPNAATGTERTCIGFKQFAKMELSELIFLSHLEESGQAKMRQIKCRLTPGSFYLLARLTGALARGRLCHHLHCLSVAVCQARPECFVFVFFPSPHFLMTSLPHFSSRHSSLSAFNANVSPSCFSN